VDKATLKWIIAGAIVTFVVLGILGIVTGRFSPNDSNDPAADSASTHTIRFEQMGMG
jgi:hypothetical protein